MVRAIARLFVFEGGGDGCFLFFWFFWKTGGFFFFFWENYLFLRHDLRVVAKSVYSWDLETVIALTGG